MNILWFLEKELDVSFSSSGRLAAIQNLEKNNDLIVVTGYRYSKMSYNHLKSKIIYIESHTIPILKRMVFFNNQLRFLKSFNLRNNIDTVLINSINYLLIRAIVNNKKLTNCKVVFDVRTLPVDGNALRRKVNSFLFRDSLKYASKFCDGITYITEEMRRYCQERYRLSDHNSEVWSSGVDINRFKNLKKNGIKSDQTLRIIYHGTVARNRGIDNVIKAIELIKNKIPIKFGIMGSGDGLEELRQLVHKMDLNGNVSFLEPVSYHRVPEIINEFDVGILPFQHFSGWNVSSPIKLFEFLSCEKPVIATKISAHTQVLGNNKFAFWAEESSPHAIASAIVEAYKHRENFGSVGIEARKFVKNHYTWETQVRRLENFLTDLQ